MEKASCRCAGVAVTAQQFGCSCKILSHSSVRSTLQGGSKESVSAVGNEPCSFECGLVERVRNGHRAPSEELAHLAVRVWPAWLGKGAVFAFVLRPERAQDKDGPAIPVSQQCAEGGSKSFAIVCIAKVVLSLVEPHHRAGPHLLKAGQSRFRPARIEGVPQSPAAVRQDLDGLPACPRLTCRRWANQDQQPAPSTGSRLHHTSKRRVMPTSHISGQVNARSRRGRHACVVCPLCRGGGQTPGRMHLQVVRVPLAYWSSHTARALGHLPFSNGFGGSLLTQAQHLVHLETEDLCDGRHGVSRRHAIRTQGAVDGCSPQARPFGDLALIETSLRATLLQAALKLTQ